MSKVAGRLLLAGLAVGAGIGLAPGCAAAAETARPAAYQERLDGALQRMLDAMVGPGRSVVTTTVALNLDQVETTSTTYTRDPAAGAVSERMSRQTYADGSGARSVSSEVARTTAFDSVRETRREAPGDVERLTVAVLVDATAAKDLDLARVRELVVTAAGIDRKRGDVVTVAAMPFQAVPGPATVPVTDHRPAVLAAAAVLVALLAAVLLLAARRRGAVRPSSAPEILLRSEPLRVTAHTPPQPVPAIAAPPARAIAPDQAAAHLRGWIDSGR